MAKEISWLTRDPGVAAIVFPKVDLRREGLSKRRHPGPALTLVRADLLRRTHQPQDDGQAVTADNRKLGRRPLGRSACEI